MIVFGPSGVEKILGISELNEHVTTRLAEVKKQLKDELETGTKYAECNELNVPYNTFTYSDVVRKLLIAEPKVKAPLYPDFAPVVLGKRDYTEAGTNCVDSLHCAQPRDDGCARYTMKVFPDDDPRQETSIILAGILIQEMICQRSATSLP